MKNTEFKETLTFDDVLLTPRRSDVLPAHVNVSRQLTEKIRLMIPLMSAAMDTVTEAEIAVSLAREGGIGVIHKNMSIEKQAKMVVSVKRSESGVVTSPYTLSSDAVILDAFNLMKKHGISGIPILKNNKPVGIITNRDLRFETDLSKKVTELMTTDLVSIKQNADLDEAKKLLHKHRIEKLIVIDDADELAGLITLRDIQNREKFPNAAKDERGRLIVGAAVGIGNKGLKRAEALIDAGVDLLVIDSAHGHSENVLKTVSEIKKKWPETDICAGNIVTREAAVDLYDAGADVVKVGIGPGSICTTRVVSGVGYPQLSAIMNVAPVAKERGKTLIADGGVKYSGDIVKALAAGADFIMMGSMFAGTDEAPGELILYQGRRYKMYRGMGSLGAMKHGSKDRYFQEDVSENKMVPEGIEGRVSYKGPVRDTIHQLVGGIRSGMGYVGASNIDELKNRAKFIKISTSSYKESHVHDVMITKEAPNYKSNV
ncbi:MAG: IMP dehydrogenase [bacterium]